MHIHLRLTVSHQAEVGSVCQQVGSQFAKLPVGFPGNPGIGQQGPDPWMNMPIKLFSITPLN